MQILLFLYLYTLLSVHLFVFAMPRASTVKKDEAGMRFTTFSMPPSSVRVHSFPGVAAHPQQGQTQSMSILHILSQKHKLSGQEIHLKDCVMATMRTLPKFLLSHRGRLNPYL